MPTSGGPTAAKTFTCHGSVAALHLRRPKDHMILIEDELSLVCAHCKTVYPVIKDIPIPIDDASSVFAISDYSDGGGYEGTSWGSRWENTNPVRHRLRRYCAGLEIRHRTSAILPARMRLRRFGECSLSLASSS